MLRHPTFWICKYYYCEYIITYIMIKYIYSNNIYAWIDKYSIWFSGKLVQFLQCHRENDSLKPILRRYAIHTIAHLYLYKYLYALAQTIVKAKWSTEKCHMSGNLLNWQTVHDICAVAELIQAVRRSSQYSLCFIFYCAHMLVYIYKHESCVLSNV